MIKLDIINRISEKTGVQKTKAEAAVEALFESMKRAMERGERIELRGFGSFRVRQRSSRRGRNPKTGEAVDIPAKRIPYFKPGKELKELINQSTAESGETGDLD